MTALDVLGDLYFSGIFTWLLRHKKAIPTKSLQLCKNSDIMFTFEWQGYPDFNSFWPNVTFLYLLKTSENLVF